MPTLNDLSRPWEMWLVPHTHVDIGYTEPQSVVMPKNAEFLAQVLDFCAATEEASPGERFVWTCEVAWTVKGFLERYPQRAGEFLRRVREGRIEVTAIYLQLTDLFGEELLEEALEYAVSLSREEGLPLTTAMNSDVNGWAWGLPRLLAERGIRYFDVAINETRALGVRPRPTPLYWAAPEGSRVLMWHGEHYMQGNSLGLDQPGAEERVAAYLHRLEEAGYPDRVVALRVQGARQDNAPPALWVCEAVSEWNEHHESPRFRLVTSRQWFEHLEQHWPEPIQEWRAAWPDWWADGNGSALYEAALVRAAQADLATAEAAVAAGERLNEQRRARAREAAMFFCEHTWGAWCSTEEPEAPESRAGWNFKAGFAYHAATEAAALLSEALESCWEPAQDGPALAVFNPLPFSRTDLVELSVIARETEKLAALAPFLPDAVGESPASFCLVDEAGEITGARCAPILGESGRLLRWEVQFVAQEVAAGGWKYFRLIPGEVPPAASKSSGERLEGPFFALRVDPQRGGVTSLRCKPSGREAVAAGDYALNQHVYETIDDPEGRMRLCTWAGPRYQVPFRRRTPAITLAGGLSYPFGASLILTGGGGDFPHLRTEIVVYDDLPRVDLVNVVTKQPRTEAEAIYHAFPLAAENPAVYLDVPGGIMRPGQDQVPGTATDWHSIQRYFAVADEDWTTVVASPEVPLVQVNGINTGKWQCEMPAANGLVMSWVMNNYWFTNFPAAQGGQVRFRYSLAAYPGPFDAEAAARFGDSLRQPLLAVLLPQGGRRAETIR